MGKQFLKNSEVSLLNGRKTGGGYLSNTETGKPVFNAEFVAAQKAAEYVVTFAEMAKGKNFKGTEGISLAAFKAEVSAALAEKSPKFVENATKPEQTVTKALAAEALAFMDYAKDNGKNAKINTYLQKFTTLDEFDEVGLFFEEDIVKLNALYTFEEVKTAVISVIDLIA